jgi:hypothetical protein
MSDAICCISSIACRFYLILDELRTQEHGSGGECGMGGKNWIVVAYERLYELPVPVILALLWLAGVALLSSCALVLYLCGSALVRMLLGP